MLTFDGLCLLLGSVSLFNSGQGRRDSTPSLGGGGGKGRGVGGRGGLTGGYKYPPEPDDHTVSQLETDGSALAAGHLATLAP